MRHNQRLLRLQRGCGLLNDSMSPSSKIACPRRRWPCGRVHFSLDKRLWYFKISTFGCVNTPKHLFHLINPLKYVRSLQSIKKVSALSLACPRNQWLRRHCVLVFNDYANTMSPWSRTMPTPCPRGKQTTSTLYPSSKRLCQHRVRVVNDYFVKPFLPVHMGARWSFYFKNVENIMTHSLEGKVSIKNKITVFLLRPMYSSYLTIMPSSKKYRSTWIAKLYLLKIRRILLRAK